MSRILPKTAYSDDLVRDYVRVPRFDEDQFLKQWTDVRLTVGSEQVWAV